jgi:SAM-dependent methyltransferase
MTPNDFDDWNDEDALDEGDENELAPSPVRGPFQGVWQIYQFNWPFYAYGLSTVLLGGLLLSVLPFPPVLAFLGWVGIGLGAWWIVASLLVSWWVYDLSSLYQMDWLPARLGKTPATWANFHAGLDETTPVLRRLFPDSTGRVFDFYNPETMTDPSIVRARTLYSPTEKATPVLSRALPVESETLDAAFFFFALHELRDRRERDALLNEVGRTLAPGGRVVLVEHGCDLANFIAFGPGFTHFYAQSEWLRVTRAARLNVVDHTRYTPFVHVFVLERPQ